MRGHYWTLRPFVRHLFRPEAPPPARHFRVGLRDPVTGLVELSGRLQTDGVSRELVLVVHGLGGSHASNYAVAMANACARARVDCLRLCLRGADRRGGDIYHAGLVADLEAALGSADLAHYEQIRLIGYSLGGHVSLRYASGEPDPRLRSLATVCTPLDLEAGAKEIDRRRRGLYRWNVLRGLKEIYAAAAASGAPLPLPTDEAQRIRTITDWDERVIAPRFGFESARHYWRTQSAFPHLGALRIPTLAVVARHDPMVIAYTLEKHLHANPHIRSVFLDRGGHVGFPPDLDLGLRPSPGGADVSTQLLAWLRSHP